MGLSRTQHLEVDPQVTLESLPLGPQEYFVLSRIEGRATVGAIIGASGLGAAATETILETLLRLGAVRTVDAPARPAVGPNKTKRRRQSTQELRAQAADRKRRMLAQQLGRGRTSTPVPTVPRQPEPPSKPPTPAEPEPEEAAPIVTPAAEDDPRIDDSLGLTRDQQRHLLALEDQLETLTPFEFLGLRPTHDLKEIRTAFRQSSRTLHPDAYHGKELGRYRELLSTLFVRAKQAHDALQKEDVRAPLMAEVEAEAEHKRMLEEQERKVAEQQEAARKAVEELRRKQEEEAAAQRRAQRSSQRTARERERLAGAVRTKIEGYLAAARAAEEEENYAGAANNYRLALQLGPNDAQIRARWEEVRAIARKKRGREAFTQASSHGNVGHRAEATRLFLEAADADPTVQHLAYAADAVRQQDPGRARNLAIQALRSLNEQVKGETPMADTEVIELRLMIGRAFLAAGQHQSAQEQARLVQKLRPNDPGARALLNSAKVT